MNRPDRQRSRVSSYCYQCVAGPDLLTVEIEDGAKPACVADTVSRFVF